MDETDVIQIISADDICRACLSEGELESIFMTRVEDNHLTLSDMLMACASVQVSAEDDLPSKMCMACIAQMIQAFSFKRKCEESDANLRLYLFNRITIEHEKSNTDSGKEDFKIEEVHLEEINDVDDESIVEYNTPSNLNEMRPNENYSDKQEKDFVVQIATLKKDETIQHCRTADVKQNECQNCNLQFDTQAEYLDHVREKKHNRRFYPCSICNKKFTRARLKAHMRSHTKEKPFSCNVCGTKFSLDTNLHRHMKIHTGERPHKCKFCDKGFTRSTLLVEHLRTHTGEKPHICNTCGMKFRQSSQFYIHRRNHELKEGETKYGKQKQNYRLPACKICNKTFSTNGAVKTHMQIHGPKTFLCSHCGKSFSIKQGLQSHMNLHSSEKLYSCQTCGKLFAQVTSLRTHQLIHTGKKPYVCNICDKSFTQSNHLKYHFRVHSGEKPYTCSVCNKSFSLNGTLTVHMRTHTGETPFLCPVCQKGFYDSSSMKKHWRKHKIGDSLKIERNYSQKMGFF